MKKKYIIPSCEEIKLSVEYSILAVSDPTSVKGRVGEEELTDGYVGAPDYNEFDEGEEDLDW